MIKFLLKFFNFNKCTHPNVEVTRTLSYCPDCGKLIRTNWYIIRCACCGKKRIGILHNGKIVPIARFCTNCGTQDFIAEKLENLNYFDLNYAIAKKEEEKITPHPEVTQTWCEEVSVIENLRLIPRFLN